MDRLPRPMSFLFQDPDWHQPLFGMWLIMAEEKEKHNESRAVSLSSLSKGEAYHFYSYFIGQSKSYSQA